MAKQSFKTAVGAFVIGGLTLLVAGIILLGGGRMFSDDIEYVLYFDGSVSGLSIGAPVVFRGVPMGQVTRISLEANPRDASVTIPVYIRLDENSIVRAGVAGELTDHYNPQDNNLYLSDANRSGGSVASVAVACHEAGHAAQRQSGYAMMKVRTALVPVVNFTQNTWTIVLLLGLFMNIAGLTTLALIFFSFSVLFQLVTLPVEIDASRRAVAYIEQSGMSSKQVNGAKKVLTAAALTYVAAALTSIIQLLYLMARYNRNSNR